MSEITDPDEFERRRFRRDTEVLLDPEEYEEIEEDEYNIDLILRKDSDPNRAEQLMQIAHEFSRRATSARARAWYLRIAAICGATVTLWQVKKHFWDKYREDN